MSDLVAFLKARLDEDEARARRKLEAAAEWPGQVWVTPRSEGVVPSVAVAEDAPKAPRRIWPQDENAYPHVDHGWVVHDTATCVWSADEARRQLREVEAKRLVMGIRDEALGGAAPDFRIADVLEEALRCLAAVYSDHPDYDEAWRP
jgi:Family of unknown function (DUF6221)